MYRLRVRLPISRASVRKAFSFFSFFNTRFDILELGSNLAIDRYRGYEMAQSDKGTGKSKRGKPPANVFEFPQTGSHAGADDTNNFATPNFNLSRNEQALYDELIKTARLLDKRHIPGVYAHVADVIDQVSALKVQGANVIPALARGLDHMKSVSFEHRAKRLKDWRDLTHDGREGPGVALCFMLGAVGALISGISSTGDWYYVSAFLASCAVACLVPTIWDMYTGK